MDLRFYDYHDLMVWYASLWIKTPGHWGTEHGGDDFLGMDCSGFLSEVVQAVGLAPHRMRLSAHDWYRYFTEERGCQLLDRARCGALQFFFDENDRVVHVNICFNGAFVVGAIGVSSKVTGDEEAAARNAFVKMRPVDYVSVGGEGYYRRVVYLDPFSKQTAGPDDDVPGETKP